VGEGSLGSLRVGRRVGARSQIDLSLLPKTGYHFLKAPILDATFEIERPELLDLSPSATEGFTGDSDHWHANTEFGIRSIRVFQRSSAAVFRSIISPWL
jgi:hypothetical protein